MASVYKGATVTNYIILHIMVIIFDCTIITIIIIATMDTIIVLLILWLLLLLPVLYVYKKWYRVILAFQCLQLIILYNIV